MASILLIDDDALLVQVLARALDADGHQVHVAFSAEDALMAFESVQPQLVLLDLNLPDCDGLLLLGRLRERESVPLIVLSGRDHQVDRVLGFKFGADDFVAKPFDYDELLARIDAVLRRASRPDSPSGGIATVVDIQVGQLVISTARVSATYAGKLVHFTPTEFHMLVALGSRPNEVVSHARLAQIVWGYTDPGTTHMVDVHLGRIRNKLRAIAEPVPLETLRGRGYRLVAQV
jgi:DNA-binding response OmpR family regulator